MTEITDLLLTSVLNHGAVLLGAGFFLAALGVPLPATMLLLAAGAFVRQGVLPLQATLLAGVGGAILGDASSYWLGRWATARLPGRWQRSSAWQKSRAVFLRWGGWSVFATRFLLTPMALPVNVMAGSSHFPFARFLLAVACGEVVWVALFGGLGYVFAQQWEGISQLASDMAGVLAGGVLVVIGLYVFWKNRAAPRSTRPEQH